LIAESIDSVPELEAILLLREKSARDWTATEAGERLYVSKTVAGYVLATLAERGFFVFDGERYRYQPASPELAAAIDEFAATYARHLVEVTQLIHAKPSPGVRGFAEAFRIRKTTSRDRAPRVLALRARSLRLRAAALRGVPADAFSAALLERALLRVLHGDERARRHRSRGAAPGD
jgi:hypothetical protein